VEEEAEKPNHEWSRMVSKVLDGLNTKKRLRELVLFERLYGWELALSMSAKKMNFITSENASNLRN
jgi:hypothetical protein